MRILFVTSTYPEDIQMSLTGIHQRMKMFMQTINAFADLDVLFYVNPSIDISSERIGRMEELLQEFWDCKTRVFLCPTSGKSTVSIPWNSRLSDWLRDLWFIHPFYYYAADHEQLQAFNTCLERNPDMLFVHRLNSMYPVLSSRKVVQPVFFDLDDIEHRKYIRTLKQPPLWRSKFLQYLKIPSLMWLERRAIRLSDKTFVCSENDRDYLKKTMKLPNVVSIPNAATIPPLREPPNVPTFLFLGTYKYPPNAAAADYLISNIWPAVKREIPEAKLVIAGECPENIGCYQRQNEGVEFKGFVEDLDKMYGEISVVCCPIQAGGGTRIKIIEAAAYGKAIVSTALGAEGLHFVDRHEIMICDDPDIFAQTCIDLINDSSLCIKIGKAAHAKCKLLYSRDSIKRSIENEFAAHPVPWTQDKSYAAAFGCTQTEGLNR